MRFEMISIIKLFSEVMISVLSIIFGLLIVKHQSFIAYFQPAFTFIREDYKPKENQKKISFIIKFWQIIKDAFFLIIGSKEDRKNERHVLKLTIAHYIILFGELLISFGLINIIYYIILTLSSFN